MAQNTKGYLKNSGSLLAVIKTAEYTGKMGLGLAAGGADGEDFVAAVGNQHLMFPLR